MQYAGAGAEQRLPRHLQLTQGLKYFLFEIFFDTGEIKNVNFTVWFLRMMELPSAHYRENEKIEHNFSHYEDKITLEQGSKHRDPKQLQKVSSLLTSKCVDIEIKKFLATSTSFKADLIKQCGYWTNSRIMLTLEALRD